MRKLKTTELLRKSVSEFKESEKTPVVIVLDNVRSALNVGSVFRTADAFLIESIYLCGITAQPPNRDIQKTALGATETVVWNYYEKTIDAVAELKAKGFKIIAVEQTSASVQLHTYEPHKKDKIAIVFGNEISGVEQDVVNAADFALEIPQAGFKHSLNISVCVGIVCWGLFLKMKLSFN